jgi:predicted glycoside hydrolase/deacetylase ChbG (UPF0249 family)
MTAIGAATQEFARRHKGQASMVALGLHVDLTSPRSRLGRRLRCSEDEFETTGDFVMAVKDVLTDADVVNETAHQMDSYQAHFDGPASISVHHYVDAISPAVRLAVARTAHSVFGTVRLRGRAEPLSSLLRCKSDACARVALHVAGYPADGMWESVPQLESLLVDASYVDLVIHPDDDPGCLEGIARDLLRLKVRFQ